MPIIAGVDEAGRGALVGDVYAAAVILDPSKPITGLNDSKKLSPKRREILCETIERDALAWAIGTANPKEIETLNILHASLLAMERAINSLTTPPEHILIDGNQTPKNLPCSSETIIQGDSKIDAISAASILAKVHRDRYMLSLDKDFPHYGFAKHKGYGTADHLAALQTHGVLDLHRRGYKPVDILLKI